MESANKRFDLIRDAATGERTRLYDQAYNVVEPGLAANQPNRRRQRRIAQYCEILRGCDDILEIGCGTGDLTAALVQMSGGQASGGRVSSVVAIDLSARRLEIAASRILTQ